MLSFLLGILYVIPTIGVLYFANDAFDVLAKSAIGKRPSTLGWLLLVAWFIGTIALAWSTAWVVMLAIEQLGPMFGFLADNRLVLFGLVAGKDRGQPMASPVRRCALD
jgi:hypothetical protein